MFVSLSQKHKGYGYGAREQSEEEGAAEMELYELITTSIPHPLVPLRVGGDEVEDSGVKLSLGRSGVGKIIIIIIINHNYLLSLFYSVINLQ